MRNMLLSFLVIFSFAGHFYGQKVPPQFSELKGFEDAQGSTHLLYRIYSYERDSVSESTHKDIYNLVPGTPVDELFLTDWYFCGYIPAGSTVADYKFWHNDITKYIYCGESATCFEPAFFISRFDSLYVFGPSWNWYKKIEISGQNDSLVYCGFPVNKSTDGGLTWEIFNDSLEFLSLSPFDDETYFAAHYGSLFKTINDGADFFKVDTANAYEINFYYDQDQLHIYRCEDNRIIKRSSDHGNAFTWEMIYSADGQIYLSTDPSQSGTIYLADGRRIFYSSDYGSTFQLFKELDYKLVGIYKKPGSDKLYAADKYRIMEITDDTISVLKRLPVPHELISLYPLKTGYKWVYNFEHYYAPGGLLLDTDILSREVFSEEIKPNGKKYFRVEERFAEQEILKTVFERVDTIEGKVFRYSESCPGSEQMVDDLLLDVNDSTFASRFTGCGEIVPTVLLGTSYFNQWGIRGTDNHYFYNELLTADYHLLTDIGLESYTLTNDNGMDCYVLKGMIKNGIVYGDTTMSDIKEISSQVPNEYKLEQNYPNPFNPVTKIRWQSPHPGLQQIKIYDLLGNEIAELINEYKPAGTYEAEFDASKLPSGVYFYRLNAGNFAASRKMVILK